MIDNKTTQTNVQTVDIDLDELLGSPGASSVMTPDEVEVEKPKNNIFSPTNPDTTFLDKPITTDPIKPEPIKNEPVIDSTKPVVAPVIDLDDEDPLDIKNANDDIKEDKNKGGRPKGLVSVTKNLIEKGIVLPFDGDKKIEDYTEADIEELLELNFKEVEATIAAKHANELPEKFFGNLPVEMQQAYHYIANGGTDIKGMFAALASSVEMQDLDISQESGQKATIRAYLNATQYGTPEEIEDEIVSLEDRNELEKKSKQFKPKLDAMQQQIVEQKLIKQEQERSQRQKQSQMYMDSVYGTLEKGELNGVKLDNKTQNMLYSGLVQSNYPSISGKQTNMLGHYLEKYQWVEPRHDLIAEALWLLHDPEGYRKSIGSVTQKEVTAKTMRTLKTEQASKSGAGQMIDDASETPSLKRGTIARPKNNFFGR